MACCCEVLGEASLHGLIGRVATQRSPDGLGKESYAMTQACMAEKRGGVRGGAAPPPPLANTMLQRATALGIHATP